MKKTTTTPGIIAVFAQIIILAYIAYSICDNWEGIGDQSVGFWIVQGLLSIAFLCLFGGYIVIQPNEVGIVSFLGTYKGIIDRTGFSFVNPFYGKCIYSVAVENHQTEVLTVNDKNGLPVQIAAVISHKITDVYKAHYDVQDLDHYVVNQCEISLRELAKNHTYAELSNEDQDFIANLNSHLVTAGVSVVSAKITHLQLSPEITAMMLQKQQAQAISEAKKIIVENAVDMANEAAVHVSGMDSVQKAKFITDLVIVLTSEHGVSPVISVS
jgi:regulator of protease activity HflC (stomatin/prohibitin superfamily)